MNFGKSVLSKSLLKMDGSRLKLLGQRDLSVLMNLSPDEDSNEESQMFDDFDVSDVFIEL